MRELIKHNHNKSSRKHNSNYRFHKQPDSFQAISFLSFVVKILIESFPKESRFWGLFLKMFLFILNKKICVIFIWWLDKVFKQFGQFCWRRIQILPMIWKIYQVIMWWKVIAWNFIANSNMTMLEWMKQKAFVVLNLLENHYKRSRVHGSTVRTADCEFHHFR